MSYYDPSTGILQGASSNPQGSSPTLGASSGSGMSVQSSPTGATQYLQPTASPNGATFGGAGLTDSGVSTFDPAAAQAAADAAKAGALRGEITNLVNSVKDIFNQRYGQATASGQEQAGKLNTRFGNESQDVTQQVEGENQKLGAAFASRGAADSSYRGNAVDTVTHAGESQIRDLGQELSDNLDKIAAFVEQQHTASNAQKGGMDTILQHLSEETDPNRLTDLRNTIDSKLTELQAGGADNNTTAQNAATLASIAPSDPRVVQLKTTLSQIVAGNADASQKLAIGNKLIQNSAIAPEDQQKLLQAFQGDLSSSDQQQQAQTA